MQKLLNEHFHQEEYGKCQNEACQQAIYKTKPGKPTDIEIMDPAQGIVIAINRQRENPYWSTEEFLALPNDEKARLVVRVQRILLQVKTNGHFTLNLTLTMKFYSCIGIHISNVKGQQKHHYQSRHQATQWE